ncbi:6-phosphogluconolactonase [Kaistella flava (ex Peng et al. 2021)]|uniref:6-phosphogluconolactonase n=1 Tax=Kaistella flava (ex Peng et al. 2021) TaxID=2038776 RepID=A0A7M2YC45_9FLAO|nr:6-phosphogluconolactonase [Kaistella flava (ex Peng et al. 2021)]QOW11838.1 6-phosphogluconolactonase [Kaistella flava (ex Peng et al. 2021)]
MDLHIYNNVDEVMNALAQSICHASELAIKKRGRFNFVLSGGSSPRKLYELLASKNYHNKIAWNKTYFFFGDERFVPENDSQRNSLMVKEVLFDPLKITKSHIFNVNTTGSPEEAAQKYQKAITSHFQTEPVEFDFILLGLGDNSHTASLFPNTPVLEETEATVKSVFVKEVDMYRITMTAPLINQARNIAFLVFGEGKAEAVFHVLKDPSGSDKKYPARLIKRQEKKVQWFLDRTAAARL